MKKKGKIYISIPISGLDQTAQRHKADTIKSALSKQGWEVFNPFDIYVGKNATYEDYICADLRALMDCDAVYFCKGWEESCGCRIEHDVVLNFMLFSKKIFSIRYEESYGIDKISKI